MDSRHEDLEEELQRRELVILELHGSLHEVETKFVQLENAFRINLEQQKRREVEINRIKEDNQELRRLNEETLKARTEVSSRLMNAINEKDHWRNAFLRQKELIKRCKVDHENAMDSVKEECEAILKATRETTEKHFQELIEVYNDTRKQVYRLEEEAEMYRIYQRGYEGRSFELANLLETLKNFDVDVRSICQLVAKALKYLTDPGNFFEENLKNLRHLTWSVEDTKNNTDLNLLKKQNFILKEVVKNLKRKIQSQAPRTISENKSEKEKEFYEPQNKLNLQNFNSTSDEPTRGENYPSKPIVSSDSLIKKNRVNCDMQPCDGNDRIKIIATDRIKTSEAILIDKSNDFEECNENKMRDGDNGEKVLCVESHSNGVFYEEFIFRLSTDREIRIKYPSSINADTAEIKMEFVDDESEYEKPPLDGMLILLKNIYASVNIKQANMSCGTQTKKLKTTSRFTQTVITAINTFSRLNVGVTMLNTEKRAIERSLCNLEQTVADLKMNALGQAQTK